MARPLRLSFPNAAYHIIARGNRKEPIFLDDHDKKCFLDKLNEMCKKYSISCFAYCLMDNHYHLFLRTPLANISDGMHCLNSSYTNWFKTKHKIVGVLFQGRFKSILVDEDNYALYLSTYIHANPHRAGLVSGLREYQWSSYLDYVDNKRYLDSLDSSFILRQLHNEMTTARQRYESYVDNNLDITLSAEKIYKGIALGDENYVQSVLEKFKDLEEKREIPLTRELSSQTTEDVIQRVMEEFSISHADIFSKKRGNFYRQLTLYLLKQHTTLSLKEIGNLFEMDYAAVSQSCKRYQEKLNKIIN